MSLFSPFAESGPGPDFSPQAVALLESAYVLCFVLTIAGAPIFLCELYSFWRGGRLDWRRATGMATNAFCFAPAKWLEPSILAAIAWAYFHVAPIALFHVPTNFATGLVCLLAADFIYYWEHRAEHEVNALWSLYHAVHHSADHFDQTVAQRVSFISNLLKPMYYRPLALLGFHPLLIFASIALTQTWQQWIHTETIGKLPLLDPWLNTPSNHRAHHGRNAIYLDRNHGGVLIVWDRLFGTYQPETQPVDYGLVSPMTDRNPLVVLFGPLWRLARELWRARAVGPAMRTLFSKPAELAGAGAFAARADI